MRTSSILAAALAAVALGCATTGSTPPGAVAGGYSEPMCMPCPNPCSPDSSCRQAAVAAAPAPAPAPAPVPAVVKEPPRPALASEARFDPAPGTYMKGQTVALSSETPGATIRYTTDGSEPTSASPVYAGPISIERSTTIRAVASATGMADSPAARGVYTIESPPVPAAAPPRVVVTKQKVELKEKVFFETGKATLKPASFSLLDEAATVLKGNPGVKRVVVEGHTDDRGGTAFNQKLSEGRANAVRDYLVGKGIAAERLDAKGFGETRPVADNKTTEGREANRRVELMIAE